MAPPVDGLGPRWRNRKFGDLGGWEGQKKKKKKQKKKERRKRKEEGQEENQLSTEVFLRDTEVLFITPVKLESARKKHVAVKSRQFGDLGRWMDSAVGEGSQVERLSSVWGSSD